MCAGGVSNGAPWKKARNFLAQKGAVEEESGANIHRKLMRGN